MPVSGRGFVHVAYQGCVPALVRPGLCVCGLLGLCAVASLGCLGVAGLGCVCVCVWLAGAVYVLLAGAVWVWLVGAVCVWIVRVVYSTQKQVNKTLECRHGTNSSMDRT